MKRKTLQELTLLDRFLFAEVMEDPENLQTVLEIILGKDVALKYLPQSEKEQRSLPYLRQIRMDVWAQDTDGTVYDAEAQKRNTGNLPRRSRYYQALIDSKLLEPGEVDFNTLHDVVSVLIAPFDLFGYGRYAYTFSMTCRDIPELELNDGALRIFLNTRGTDDENVTPELKELLCLFEHTNDEEREFQSSRVQNLQKNIHRIQQSEEIGVKYMQAWEEKVYDRMEAREEGRAEGLAEGRQMLLEIISRKLRLGKSSSQIATELDEEISVIEELVAELSK